MSKQTDISGLPDQKKNVAQIHYLSLFKLPAKHKSEGTVLESH